MNKIKDLINKLIDKITKRNKWKLYLYLSNQLVKIIYTDVDEKPFESFYVITISGKKHLIGTNKRTTIVVKPTLLKYTENDKKRIHIEVEMFSGVSVYE